MQLGIGQTLKNHRFTLIKAYSKPAKEGFTIKAKLLALLEALCLAKILGLSDFLVEGNLVVNKKERDQWRYGW